MGAFNYVSLSDTCVRCKTRTTIKVQTHMAASFNGDEAGRFCHETYKIGQKMRWWLPNNSEFETWVDPNSKQTDNNTYLEECIGSCEQCKKDLIAILEFKDLTPIAVREIRADN